MSSKNEVQVLISVRHNGRAVSQVVAGGIPKYTAPDWITFDGETQEDVLKKILINVAGTYSIAVDNTNETRIGTLTRCVNFVTEFLNKPKKLAS